MDRLWAPWRSSYVANPTPTTNPDACFFCEGLAAFDDRANLLLHRGELVHVVLNRYPYNNGHLLVAPKRHVGEIEALTVTEVTEIHETMASLVTYLKTSMRAEGFNIGLNLGRAAGAGVPGHLHWHIVPRWDGDSNFMPVLADTRVISQALDSLYDMLTQWKKQAPP